MGQAWGQMEANMRNHGALNTSVGILWAITLAAIFYLLVLLTMSVAAKAADYTLTVGQQATFGLSINACDTQVQIEDIVAANEKDGFMAGVAAYTKWRNTPNAQGEPTCGVVQDYITITRLIRRVELPWREARATVNVVEFTASGDTYFGVITEDKVHVAENEI